MTIKPGDIIVHDGDDEMVPFIFVVTGATDYNSKLRALYDGYIHRLNDKWSIVNSLIISGETDHIF